MDALYFSVTTLTTVGLGDLAPATDAGKLFTVAFALTTVGLLVSFLSMVAEQAIRGRTAAPGSDAPGPAAAG